MGKVKRTRVIGTTGKWKPIFVVHAYRMVRMGVSDKDISQFLGVSRVAWWKWLRDKPELKEAVELARKENRETETFPDWVYGRLSPELKAVWDKVMQFHREKAPVAKLEMLLSDHGKRVRQQLFLFALCMENFSPSSAMHRVNVSKKTLESWMLEDPDFAQLVEEVDWHKGNFFEWSLVQLVREGNPQAILFANKTFNSRKGYGKRDQLDVNVSGNVLHGVLDLAELLPMLSEAARTELLSAIRSREQQQRELTPATTPEDAVQRKIVEVLSGPSSSTTIHPTAHYVPQVTT